MKGPEVLLVLMVDLSLSIVLRNFSLPSCTLTGWYLRLPRGMMLEIFRGSYPLTTSLL